MITRTENYIYTCVDCGMKFDNDADADKHCKIHTEELYAILPLHYSNSPNVSYTISVYRTLDDIVNDTFKVLDNSKLAVIKFIKGSSEPNFCQGGSALFTVSIDGSKIKDLIIKQFSSDEILDIAKKIEITDVASYLSMLKMMSLLFSSRKAETVSYILSALDTCAFTYNDLANIAYDIVKDNRFPIEVNDRFVKYAVESQIKVCNDLNISPEVFASVFLSTSNYQYSEFIISYLREHADSIYYKDLCQNWKQYAAAAFDCPTDVLEDTYRLACKILNSCRSKISDAAAIAYFLLGNKNTSSWIVNKLISKFLCYLEINTIDIHDSRLSAKSLKKIRQAVLHDFNACNQIDLILLHKKSWISRLFNKGA